MQDELDEKAEENQRTMLVPPQVRSAYAQRGAQKVASDRAAAAGFYKPTGLILPGTQPAIGSYVKYR
jgi:hypothetical protein